MKNNSPVDNKKFGTFGGVFVPCVLTIFGVIMFMRAGFVVGHAGVWGILAILAVSNLITVITTLSLSAITTNIDVKGGGAYFMISRSLGPEFGGAIGVTLYLAQGVSIALYIFGFTEALVNTWPAAHGYFLPIAFLTTLMIFGITFVGARWAIRAQYIILTILLGSIISFLAGLAIPKEAVQHAGPLMDVLKSNLHPSGEISVFMAFAIFFPAATGIMAGASMSGDLKDPKVSIPKGTLLAIAFTGITYLVMMILMASSIPKFDLIATNPGTGAALVFNELVNRSVFPPLVIAGVFAATLSSALGSFLGAPRVLQALARDNIFNFLKGFANGSGVDDEPRRATVLTAVIVLIVIVSGASIKGGLDVIAAIITMFFMITYGTTNFATFYETIGANPSFRPTFRFFNWWTALVGAVSCMVVMFLINIASAIVALVLLYLLYDHIRKKQIEAAWGDSKRGFFFSRVRQNLLFLDKTTPHPKNWRPQILILSSNPSNREWLTIWSNWMEAGKGLLTITDFIVGDTAKNRKKQKKLKKELAEYISAHDINVFNEVIIAESFFDGLSIFLQSYGIGEIKPNTITIGWSPNPMRAKRYVKLLRIVEAQKKNIVIISNKMNEHKSKHEGFIDIWWRGQKNGSLMVILGHLMTLSHEWKNSNLRLRRVIKHEEKKEKAEEDLKILMEEARIDATILIDVYDGNPMDFIKANSKNTLVTFLGLAIPEPEDAPLFIENMNTFLEELNSTILVYSVGDADVFE